MRRLLFWIAAGLVFTGCHSVPDSTTDPSTNGDAGAGDAGKDTSSQCGPEEREWVATPVYTFENTTVELNAIWTDGTTGWVAGYQDRLGTRKATIWKMSRGEAVLEWERQDRDQVAFRALDCIETQATGEFCVGVGDSSTAAILSGGTWSGTDIGGGDWRDVVGTTSNFLAVNGEDAVAGSGQLQPVMSEPPLSRVGCVDTFCVGAGDDGFVHTTADPTSWDAESGWQMPCSIDPDECFARAVEVPEEGVAMVATDVGHVYRTTDGGENWTGQMETVADVDFIDLSMLDRDHGWLVEGGGGIRRTEDGEAWTTVPVVSLGVSTARRAYLYDRDKAWVATEDGIVDFQFACP